MHRSTALLARLALLVVVVLVSGACATNSAQSKRGDVPSIILITPNPVSGNNFLQLGVDGVKAAAKQNGAVVQVYESTDPTSMSQNLDAAVREKPDVVVTIAFQFNDLMTSVPPDHPDQQFALIDSCPEKPAKNLTCVLFKEHEASYLAGVEAGLLTKTGKLGVVAALDTPFLHRWVDPFAAGATSVNPASEVATLYVGGNNPFNDPARSKAQALTLAETGIDYMQAAASGGNLGVFEAAEAGTFKTFGVDTNQCPISPGNVVDNVIKRVDVVEIAAIKDIFDGKSGGVKAYGLAEDGVGLTGLTEDVKYSSCLIADHPDILEKVKQIRDDIVAGKVKVKDPLAG